MAKSRFEYVKNFELDDTLLPNTHILVRIDGRGFHKFSDIHEFEKPNDIRALHLMNTAAQAVMNELADVVLAFGESDEYSFLIRKTTTLYSRRRSKINSTVVSIFTSAFVFYWTRFFPDYPLKYPPSFDSRVVLYPTEKEVRDYFAWRQADTHINNLYNTSFWALVKSGQTTAEANKSLQGTDSKDKNELLFSKFGINYNNISPMYRKGSTLVRQPPLQSSALSNASTAEPTDEKQKQRQQPRIEPEDAVAKIASDDPPEVTIEQQRGKREKKERKIKAYDGTSGEIVVIYEDLIRDGFWESRPWLLA